MSVGDLIPYAGNARKHDAANVNEIASSISEYGFNDPIAINEKDNIIIEGHGRLMAAKALGMEKVPVLKLGHLSPAQIKGYTLIHNRLAEKSEWDKDILEVELRKLAEMDFDITATGFGPGDLADMDIDLGFDMPGEGGTEGLTDEDEVPEVEKNAYGVRLGDLWQLGRHLLLCGDSTVKESMQKVMGDAKADMVFTDPPYNVAYEGSDGQSIMNDKMSDSSFAEFLMGVYRNYFDALKDGGPIYVFHSDSMRHIFTQTFIDTGFKFSGNIVWNKNSLNMGRFDYHMKHEPCLYGWKPGAAHPWYSDRKQTSVFDHDKPTKNDIHPTMKPVGLVSYFISNSSQPGETVIDFFGGSGSTLIASEKLGRISRLIELDPHYCSVIIKRWEDYTGEKAQCLTRSQKPDAAQS